MGDTCRCGTERVLVRSGSIVRVAMTGAFPYSVAVRRDPFEANEARCAGCGTSDGDPDLLARAVDAARRHDAGPVTMSFAPPVPEFARLPIDEPLCGCGSIGASVVLYGDTVSAVREGAVVGEAFRPRADPGNGTRWECCFGAPDACPTPREDVTAVRDAAMAHVIMFLERVPDVGWGEPLSAGAMTGWPDRKNRARSRPAGLPGPVEGMTVHSQAWLEDPQRIDRAAAFVRAGFSPVCLLSVYPAHRVRARFGTSRLTCGNAADRTWLGTGLEPERALLWFREGVWPCCAIRYSRAGLTIDRAAGWRAAGFKQPDEAASWENEQFSPHEARAWTDAGIGAPSAARACQRGGLSPQTVPHWGWIWGGRQAGSASRARGPSPTAEHLAQIVAWQAAGLDGRQARAWTAAGLEADDARSWPPGHPNRPADEQLVAMASLRGPERPAR